MFNALSESHTISPVSFSPCCVGISEQTVIEAVGAIISRMVPTYCELMREAKERPEIISDHKSYLYAYYAGQSITSEMRSNLEEAEKMAPNWKAVTKMHSNKRISVFSENNEFDETQALRDARLYIKLRVNTEDVKNVQEQDPLDNLLSQLSKKIFSQGYGKEGTFDIRLEKGYLPLEANPWKWHFDGEIFKTSITVCYSNKQNWSTRVWDSAMGPNGKPADHDFLYDALNIYHRAPIPSDLEGDELQPDDYRLFIRYNEFYKSDERTIPDRAEPEKDKNTLNLNPFGRIDAVCKPTTTYLEQMQVNKKSFLSPGHDFISKNTNLRIDQDSIKICTESNLLVNIERDLKAYTPPTLNFKYKFSETLIELPNEVDLNATTIAEAQNKEGLLSTLEPEIGYSYTDNSCCSCTII